MIKCVNPGPEPARQVGNPLPAGRWGRPEETARLVRRLVTDQAARITGQVVDSEGGFRRWAR
ncbi:hypothetical protein ACNF49_18935 [Actinomadura sp. ATCC 39365]